ncbi:mechanosensitive ion channel family protein [Vibrio sp. RC27]
MVEIDIIIEYLSTHKLLSSILLIIYILIIRRVLLNRIRGDVAFLSEKQRKWMSRTKNSVSLLIIFVTFLIWRTEINHFALSVTAIAVAIVLASKEIILCFTGSIQRASSRSFVIGDWIEVGTLCGEVIEHNLMATTIQELDVSRGFYHYTGKTATLPNSMFFSFPVKNLNFMKRYVYHSFDIVIPRFVNLYPIIPTLKEQIDQHCEDFIEVAKRYNSVVERHAGVDLPGPEPLVRIDNGEHGEQVLYFMLFCPTERAGELEQLIRADFMTQYQLSFPDTESLIQG